MKPLEQANPLAAFVYFLCVVLAVAFTLNPVMLAISFAGAAAFLLASGKVRGKTALLYFGMLLVMSLINPLFNHNGATVLFIMNNNPVTLEALIYGVCAAFMIITVLCWLKIFALIMTADKLLCLFGTASPKLALLFSMTVRYVPLFARQTKKVALAQRGLGLTGDDSIPARIHSGMRIFSIMVTWGLENGIITADSMTARGYGTGKRTFYSPFRFTRQDAIFTALTLLLFGINIFVTAAGFSDFEFYPHFSARAISPAAVASYVAYAMLSLLPSFIRIKENIVWKYRKGKNTVHIESVIR